MAKTKTRPATETVEPTAQPVVAPPADDRTALDGLAARKKGKAKLPEGFKKLLPGGVKRKVKINRAELDKPNGKAIRVTEPDGTETDYDKAEIEGPSRVVIDHEVVGPCTVKGSACVETDAPILVGNGREVGQ